MTGLIGRFALAAGGFAALAAALLWMRVARGRLDQRAAARTACGCALVAAVTAVAAAEWALLHHDFAVRIVAAVGDRRLPTYYTVTSLWSGLDGSLLLWLTILAAWLMLTARWVPRGAERLQPAATAVVCVVTVFFFGLVLTTGHVFDPVNPAPTDGPGPNPLLAEHPAMGVHPPLLYAGYTGLVVPFGYAVAALLTDDCGPAWAAAVRRSTLFAWAPLTAGIVLGAWWSYSVLGWGGYWGWDPVENASILPWFTATALLHGLAVQRRSGALRQSNVALAAAGFLLVCLGAFITRSDVLAGVHSFSRSGLGPVLATFVGGATLTVALLFLRRVRSTPSRVLAGPTLGGALSVTNLLLVTLAFTVLVGTVFPLLAAVWGETGIAVGAPYFSRTTVPVAFALLLALAVGPTLRWTRDRPAAWSARAALPAATALAVVAVLGAAGVRGVLPVATFGLAAMIAVGTVRDAAAAVRREHRRGGRRPAALLRTRRHLGAALAHLGVALAAVGLAGSAHYATVAERTLTPGQVVRVAGVAVRAVGTSHSVDGRWDTTRAQLQLTGRGGSARIDPALLFSPAHRMTVSRRAIRTRPWGDVYVTLLDVAPDGATTLRIAVEPLIGMLWAAGVLMVTGAVAAAVPVRRRRPAPAPAPAPEPVPT
jgi:cytochrome c-type biogenesis protein CcmF